MTEKLLEIRDLSVQFVTDRGRLRAVDGISFDVMPGQIVCLVGESGCGKSVTAHSIMRLLNKKSASLVGKVFFRGQELTALSDSEMEKIRGAAVSMIFQDPMTALNPVYTVGHQIAESIWVHEGKTKMKEIRERVVKLLAQVGIPDPAVRVDSYPHELSGGMRQRVMIAMALACGPKLLIADEPTTALDVTIQAQILDLIRSLRSSLGMGVLLITHDLGVVSEMADEVAVMYSGKIIEKGPRDVVLKNPQHPYTQGLLASVPPLKAATTGQLLKSIPGNVKPLFESPAGCRFQERCFAVQPSCKNSDPALEKKAGREVACYEVK